MTEKMPVGGKESLGGAALKPPGTPEPLPVEPPAPVPSDPNNPVIEREEVEMVHVAFKVDEGRTRPYMTTLTYPKGSMTKEQVDAWIAEDHARWVAVMDTPVKVPTKEDYEAQLAQARQEEVAVKAKITALTASIAQVVAVKDIEAEPLEGVKVG